MSNSPDRFDARIYPSNIFLSSLIREMAGLSPCQSYYSQCGILGGAGCELITVGNEQVLDVVSLAPFVADSVTGLFALSASAEIVGRRVGRSLYGLHCADGVIDCGATFVCISAHRDGIRMILVVNIRN